MKVRAAWHSAQSRASQKTKKSKGRALALGRLAPLQLCTMGFEGWELRGLAVEKPGGVGVGGEEWRLGRRERQSLKTESVCVHLLFGHQGSASCASHSGTERKTPAGAPENWRHFLASFTLNYGLHKNEGGRP